MVAQLATSFPTSLDTLTNPTSTSSLASPSHADQHINANDAIEALEAKVGIDGSTDVNSIQYKIAAVQTTLSSLSNTTNETVSLLGLEGNNDLTVSDIENKTTLDTFSKTAFRTVNYQLQLSRGSLYETSDIVVLNDGTDINISQSNIISNTNISLANVTFEENSGIIGLCVTPTSTAVTARYIRTAIKI
jgi:hypothetical protein